MKERFVINGPAALSGEIDVRGSKNAVLPTIAASLLTKQPCIIDNVPRIEDVFRMLEILDDIGAKVTWEGERKIRIEAKNITRNYLCQKSVSRLRASILFLGPLLSRLGEVILVYPGGDHIGRRPLDSHLSAFRALGVRVRVSRDKVYMDAKDGLKGDEVVLDEFSVTATENILMALSLCRRRTRIKMAALEPHVQDLARFLKKLGVRIKGVGTHTLEVEGSTALGGAYHFVIYDPIEAGTFIVLGALSKGDVVVKNVNPIHLELFLKKLKDIGVRFSIVRRGAGGFCDISVAHSPRIRNFSAKALPFPGIPTDLQALLGLMATQAHGESIIHDPLYENRFNYAKELKRMGAGVTFLDPHRAKFLGPSSLRGISIKSFDLRAGAALIIAGLIAEGRTTIKDAYQVDRGYEAIEKRLQALGADIRREEA